MDCLFADVKIASDNEERRKGLGQSAVFHICPVGQLHESLWCQHINCQTDVINQILRGCNKRWRQNYGNKKVILVLRKFQLFMAYTEMNLLGYQQKV
jgi:hypothetical protein